MKNLIIVIVVLMSFSLIVFSEESTLGEEKVVVGENSEIDENTIIEEKTEVEEDTVVEIQAEVEDETVVDDEAVVDRETEVNKETAAGEKTVSEEETVAEEKTMVEQKTVVEEKPVAKKTIKVDKLSKFVSSVSLSGGVTNSHIVSTKHLDYYFAPTSQVKHKISTNVQIEYEISYAHIIGFACGLHFQKVGQYTEKTTVEIQNDPFLHDFESRAEIFYVSVPFNIKLGYLLRSHWLAVRFGPVVSYQGDYKVHWKIDDQINTAITPKVSISSYDVRLLWGMEYGVKFKNNGIFCYTNYQYGVKDIVHSEISGNAYNHLWNYTIGYKRFF